MQNYIISTNDIIEKYSQIFCKWQLPMPFYLEILRDVNNIELSN